MIKMFFPLLLIVNIIFTQTAFSFETKAKQALLIDAETDKILINKNSTEKMPPSSMSKLMTILIIFEKLDKGDLSLSDKFTVSEKAWRKQGSKMFVKIGEEVSVEDLLKGIIVQSGNDACIVIAEGIASSEEDFSKLMNEKSKQIGLKNSNFTNSTGWPDPEHYMTAEDLAILAKYIIQAHPNLYYYFMMKDFTYNNIKQENRNILLNNPTFKVDGLKTGNTDLGGYGIVASAKINDRRLILVINGLDSIASRGDEAKRLLNYGFTNFTNVTLFKKGSAIENAKVWLGEKESIPLIAEKDFIVTVPKYQESLINVKLKYNSPLKSPINLNDLIGELQVFAGDEHITSFNIIAQENVKKLSFFKGILKKFKHYIFN